MQNMNQMLHIEITSTWYSSAEEQPSSTSHFLSYFTFIRHNYFDIRGWGRGGGVESNVTDYG